MKVEELADAPCYSANAAERAAILTQSLYRTEQIGGGGGEGGGGELEYGEEEGEGEGTYLVTLAENLEGGLGEAAQRDKLGARQEIHIVQACAR